MRPVCLTCLPLLLLAAGNAPCGEKPAAPLVFRGKTLLQWSGELQSVDARTRRRAATALGVGPFGKPAVAALLKAPRDEDHKLPLDVLRALYHVAPDAPEVVPLLVPHIRLGQLQFIWPPSPSITIEAARLGTRCVPLLLERIREYGQTNQPQSSEHFSLVDATFLPPLRNALKDESAKVRAAAVLGLGGLQREAASAVPQLLQLVHDPDRVVRIYAFHALAKIGVPPGGLPLLVERLREEEDRGYAASTLAALGQPGIAALRQTFASASPELRASILDQAASGGRDAFPLLLDGLRHPEAQIRCKAARALHESPAAVDELLPDLMKALAEKKEGGRPCIIGVLTRMVPPRRRVMLAVVKALSDEDEEVSAAALLALQGYGRQADDALPQLLEALKHPIVHVRFHAATLLEGRPACRLDVVRAMAKELSNEEATRSHAAVAILKPLGHHAGAVIPQLLESLKHPNDHVRQTTAMALGHIQIVQREVVLALCERLKDPAEDVRIAAAGALGQLGPDVLGIVDDSPLPDGSSLRREIVLPALHHGLGDRRQCIRVAMAAALVRLGDRSPKLAKRLGAEALDPLGKFLGNRSDSLRLEASLALLEMGKVALPQLILLLREEAALATPIMERLPSLGAAAREAIPALRRVLHFAEDPRIRRTAAETLLKLGAEGRDVLRLALSLPDGEVHEVILNALRHMGSEGKVLAPSVLPHVRDLDGNWNLKALWTLHEIGARGEEARRIFLRALDAENEMVCWCACEALGAMGPEARAAIPSLIGCLLEPDCAIQLRAVQALRQVGPDDNRVLRALSETLTDPDIAVRKAVVKALAAAGRPALPALRLACRDRNDSVRVDAASALWRLDGDKDEARCVLRGVMLGGKDGNIRVEACLALWKHERSRDVVPVLALLLRHDVARNDATKALCSLGGARDDIRAFVRPLLKHELRAVRKAAWDVLEKVAPELTAVLVDAR